jgi:hypothetical protein
MVDPARHVRDKLVHGDLDAILTVVRNSATASVPTLLAHVLELIERFGGKDLTASEGTLGV